MTNRRGGTALRPSVQAPQLQTAEHGAVVAVDVAATVHDDSGAAFLVNRNPDRAIEVEIRLQNLPPVLGARHTVLADTDLTARNTVQHPNRVLPRRDSVTRADGSRLIVTLPPASWNMITFSTAGEP